MRRNHSLPLALRSLQPTTLQVRNSKSAIRKTVLLFALCALPFGLVRAQSASATLSGTVEDSQGAVVPGITVAVLNLDTSLQRQALTNQSGSYTFVLLP